MDFHDRRTGDVIDTSFVDRRKKQLRREKFLETGQQRWNNYVAKQEKAVKKEPR